jgi:hypothetical protein
MGELSILPPPVRDRRDAFCTLHQPFRCSDTNLLEAEGGGEMK